MDLDDALIQVFSSFHSCDVSQDEGRNILLTAWHVLSTYEKFSGVCFEMFISSIPYTWRSEYRTQINSSHWVTKSMFPLSSDIYIYIYIYIYQELACCPTELFLASDTSNVRRGCCAEQRSGFHRFSKKAMIHLKILDAR